MTYQEKKHTVMTGTRIVILATYFIYAIGRIQRGTAEFADLRFWATTMLIFIGIGLLGTIVILIGFHIWLAIAMAVRDTKNTGAVDDKKIESELEVDTTEDEMDRLIASKAARIGYGIAGAGFLVALVAILLRFDSAIVLNIIFLGFQLGALTEGITQIILYKKGVSND